MKEELNILVQAQYPLIYLITPEEERAEQAINKIAKDNAEYKRVFVWTVTRGMVEYGQPRQSTQHNTVSPEAAIEWTTRQKEGGIYIFKDLHQYIEGPVITRRLRDAIASFKDSDKVIILMSPVQAVPIELEKEVVVLDYPLPNVTELYHVLSSRLAQSKAKRLDTETREKLLKAALGLTKDEAEKVYRKEQVKAGRLTGEEFDIVLSEKKLIIRRNGILDYIE
ncbi:MAG: AAA family ATPase, partial [Pleurocapsa sp.]